MERIKKACKKAKQESWFQKVFILHKMSSNENQTPEPNNEIPIDSNPPSKTENKKKKKKGTIDRPDAELLAKLKEEKHERRRKQHEESIEFNNILHHIPKVPHSKWIDLPLDLENDFQHKNKLFSRSLPSNSNEKAPRFTIASYNILSQHLVRREVYRFELKPPQSIHSFSKFTFFPPLLIQVMRVKKP